MGHLRSQQGPALLRPWFLSMDLPAAAPSQATNPGLRQACRVQCLLLLLIQRIMLFCEHLTS